MVLQKNGHCNRDSGRNPDVIQFDMHVHSRFSSDSLTPIRNIVRISDYCHVLPLVCDHNTIAGSVQVYREIYSKNREIPEILAEEIMTSDGEIIGVFLQEEIPPFKSAEETLDAIRDQGALSIVPHPFCSFRSSVIRPDVLERIVHRIDIIEGFNSGAVDAENNTSACNYAAQYNKPVSAGSDSHSPSELGRTFVIIEPFSTPKDLMKVISSAKIHYRRSVPVFEAVNQIKNKQTPLSRIIA